MRTGIVFVAVGLLLLSACAGTPRLAVLEKQLDDDRLAPASAIQTGRILDSYQHLLPIPKEAPVAVSASLDQPIMLERGGQAVLQVGIATHEPQQVDKSVHFLLVRPQRSESDDNALLEIFAEDLSLNLEKIGKVTVDWSRDAVTKKNFPKPLLKNENNSNLETMLRRYLIGIDSYPGRHFIAVVADHGSLNQVEQQNVLDMANYLRSKGATLSVLAAGKRPDYGFLRKLASKGNGLFSIYLDNFDIAYWLQEEKRYVSANRLTELRVRVTLADGVRRAETISGPIVTVQDNSFEYLIPDLRQGEQRVSLFKLQIPGKADGETREVAKINLTAFDVNSGRYFQTGTEQRVAYSSDLNKVYASHDPKVERSLTILGTVNTLVMVETYLREGRPYQAMAQLVEQRGKLTSLAATLNDNVLRDDARLLEKYEQRLYGFSGESFQALKAWRDLTLDQQRFYSSLD